MNTGQEKHKSRYKQHCVDANFTKNVPASVHNCLQMRTKLSARKMAHSLRREPRDSACALFACQTEMVRLCTAYRALGREVCVRRQQHLRSDEAMKADSMSRSFERRFCGRASRIAIMRAAADERFRMRKGNATRSTTTRAAGSRLHGLVSHYRVEIQTAHLFLFSHEPG